MGSLGLEVEGAGVATAAGCSWPGERFPLMSAPATYLHGSSSTSGRSSRLADSPSLMSCIVNLSTAVHAHIKTHPVSTNAGIAVFFGFMFCSRVFCGSLWSGHCESRNGRDVPLRSFVLQRFGQRRTHRAGNRPERTQHTQDQHVHECPADHAAADAHPELDRRTARG